MNPRIPPRVFAILTAALFTSGRLTIAAAPVSTAAAGSFPVAIRVEANRTEGPMPQAWRFFGADEPNYATMTNGSKLVGELGALAPGKIHFRAHNLLTSGDGTPALKWGSTGAYSEDAEGRPVYNWKILDGIFDTYLNHGVRPYVEIGFMPKALSIHPEPYRHHWTPAQPYGNIFTGWSYPPKDYAKWEELAYQWARHCVERYGVREVTSWYWETWNEANTGYWRGTPAQFLKLHDYAIAGVRRALPQARVGGPDCAGSGGRWMRAFLEHCLHGTNLATGARGTPLDFVSFHAKGSPSYTNGHVRMGIAAQLRTVDEGFRIVASFPELKKTPVIIGESDPEGCAACQGPQLGYRNGTMYSSYTAACFAREYELARKRGVNFEGALTWAFEFENQPWFAGFRALASNGVDLPVLNVFRLFSKMKGRRLRVRSDGAVPLETILREGVREKPDVSALACLDQNRLCVLAWHYHDDDVPGPTASVSLALAGLPRNLRGLRARQFIVDHNHSNAFTVWRQMGSPAHPSAEQVARLEAAGRLAEVHPPAFTRNHSGTLSTRFLLPRQAVSLLMFEWN